jgi:hypothetical protein
MLKHGERLDWFLSLRADGKNVDELNRLPVVKPEFVVFWEAFSHLHNSRTAGEPIKFTEKVAACRFFCFGQEMGEMAIKLWTALDLECAKFFSEEQSRKIKDVEKNNPKSRARRRLK